MFFFSIIFSFFYFQLIMNCRKIFSQNYELSSKCVFAQKLSFAIKNRNTICAKNDRRWFIMVYVYCFVSLRFFFSRYSLCSIVWFVNANHASDSFLLPTTVLLYICDLGMCATSFFSLPSHWIVILLLLLIHFPRIHLCPSFS